MASTKKWWKRASQSAGTVKMGITTNGEASANNITGVWDATNLAYYFDFLDTTATAVYNEGVPYSIWDTTVEVVSEISIGAIQTAIELDAHIALSSTVHGLTTAGPAGADGGSVVGTVAEQTLTNKTMTSAANTFSIAPAEILSSSDSALLGQKIKPGSDDTYLHADVSTATVMSLQASNNAKSSDRVLRLIAGSVDLENDAGSNIKITGLAAGTATGDAVRFDEFDALDTRVEALEAGGAWTGSPAVSLSLNAIGLRTIEARFRMTSPTNEAELSRYEIFWDWGTLGGVTAGSKTTAQVEALRNFARRAVMRAGEGNTTPITTPASVHVVAVAFDSTGAAYSSAEVTGSPRDIGDLRLADGNQIEVPITMGGDITIAGTSDGNEAAVASLWLQSGTTYKVKYVQSYRHDSKVSKLRLSAFAFIDTTAHTGSGMLAVCPPAATAVIGGTPTLYSEFAIPYNGGAMPTVALTSELDVSTLTHGTVYQLEVRIKSDAAVILTKMLSNLQIEPIQNVPVI